MSSQDASQNLRVVGGQKITRRTKKDGIREEGKCKPHVKRKVQPQPIQTDFNQSSN